MASKAKARQNLIDVDPDPFDPTTSTTSVPPAEAAAGKRSTSRQQRPAHTRPRRVDKPTRRVTPIKALGPRNYTAGGRRPAADLVDVAPVKFTAYLLPGQLDRLRDIVEHRQKDGKRADVSALLREAVERTFPAKR